MFHQSRSEALATSEHENGRVRITSTELLSDNWYILRKHTFDFLRRDGQWQTLTREVYDRGNGATILLYNTEKKTVVLTRQFRRPAFVNEHEGCQVGVLEEIFGRAGHDGGSRMTFDQGPK